MKSKLVVWGQKADLKVLLALSLRAHDNKIDVYTFPEEIATEELYKNLTQDWRTGKDITFPEGHTHDVVELSASGSMLPPGITATNEDLLSRTQTEWHFAVLSAKLSSNYASELEAIKDKIEQVTDFSQPLWNELKTFWEKVQTQIRDKNIFVEHINDLKKSTNEAFDALKEKRKEMDKSFNEKSSKVKEDFTKTLNEVEEKISKGLSLQPIFEELKKLQNDFKSAMMSNSDKKNIWDRLDAAFKVVKEKRFGNQGDTTDPNSVKERLDNRYNGLITAISKMEKSIQFDKNDLDFQNKKIDGPGGQLEVQIRQAKIKMVEDRIQSKQLKLNDMLKTKDELEQKKSRIERSEAIRGEKEEAKKAAQEKIAANIKAASESRSDSAEGLEKAAQMISESKKPSHTPEKESLFSAISSVVGETFEDAVDTFKAVASVVGEKIGDAVDEMKEKASDMAEKASDFAEDIKEEVAEKYNDLTKKTDGSVVDDLKEKASDMAEKASDMVEDFKDKVTEKYNDLTQNGDESVAENLKEEAYDVAEKASDIAEDIKDKATEKFNELTNNDDKSVVEDLKEEASDMAEKVSDVAEDIKDKATEKFNEFTSNDDQSVVEDLKEEASDMAEKVSDVAEDIKDKATEKFNELADKTKDAAEDFAASDSTSDESELNKTEEEDKKGDA